MKLGKRQQRLLADTERLDRGLHEVKEEHRVWSGRLSLLLLYIKS